MIDSTDATSERGPDEPKDEPSATPQPPQTTADPEQAPPTWEEVRSDRIAVEIDYDRHVNFALQQNAVPLVKALRVRNLTDAEAADLRVVLRAEPDLSATIEIPVPTVRAHGAWRSDHVDLPLSPTRLVNLTERELGQLRIEIRDAASVLLRTSRELEVQAYGEWPGPASLPEILAAFVLPNHPEVQALLASAARLLETRTGDPAIQGYERRDPARVRAVATAVYDALAALAPTYVLPPASFEYGGQKIRTPEQVVGSKSGTCLDLATLLASVFEQAGLHPLVVLHEDHATVGVWLEDESFVDPAVDERMRIEKRIELGSIMLLDATGATTRPVLDFDAAVLEAQRRLADVEGGFLYAVDVHAARRAGIRPLPARRQDAFDLVEPEEEEPIEEAPAAPLTRVERWKRNLLDLSLRNRLLNHRATRKTVRLDCPDLERLEDRLSDGKAFRLAAAIEARTPVAEQAPSEGEAATRVESRDDPERAARLDELQAGLLRTDVSDEDLERRLVHIYRDARLSMQEGGANTLYLALGFLRWFEAPSSQTPRLSPILLYPLSMTRRSVAAGTKGYRIELADDDPQINVTLLQKLESDFEIRVPGVDVLDTDESGLDVGKILDRFRRAVRSMPRWEIVEDAVVGLFSFTKYLMWLDLDRRSDRLTENAVVRHLLETPDEPFAADVDFPDPSTFDGVHSPVDTFVPLKADSSQQTAIFAAADGHTFVLEGPPGTGKSQTISNLICHALATGKRVLFVSEKIAALDVVHKRLSKAGLAPFCLELHSNKARKRAVLEQIRQALDVAGAPSPEAWPKVAEHLEGIRSEVNAHTHALHAVRSIGRTAFYGISRLIALADAPRIRLDFGDHDALDQGDLDRLESVIRDARISLDEVGDVRDHAWRASTLAEWLPSLPDAIEDLAVRLDMAADALDAAVAGLACDLAVDPTGLSRLEIDGLREAADLFQATPLPPETLLTDPTFPVVKERIQALIETGRHVRDHVAALGDRYDERLLEIDLVDTRRRLEASRDTFWPVSWFKGRLPRKRIRTALLRGDLPATEGLLADLERAIDWRQRREEIQAADAEGLAHLGVHWRGVDTDWAAAERMLAWVERLRALLRLFAGRAAESNDATRARWIELAASGREVFAAGGDADGRAQTLDEATASIERATAEADETLALDPALAWGAADEASYAARVRSTARAWRARKADLRGWCGWVRARGGLTAAGLQPLLDALESGDVGAPDLERSFERSFYGWWTEALFEAEPVLRRFRGAEQDARIREFRRLDGEVMDVTSDVVCSRLASGLPSGRAAAESRSDSSEMGILHRELMKKRNMPIRRLFERIPDVLIRLKPCMLMSPLSVAQYLGADFPAFDLVVFDEASQIPPWDAVGAIARGERLVVVGDSKQLPPTAFFSRGHEGDESADEDDLQEMESILDECIAARLPRLHLGWHYRSRHESLIAFSNVHYYDNRLFTFPSAVQASPTLGVSWHHVPEGVYDKGRSRTNKPEAEALVADLVARLMDPDGAKRTYGVVTFSIAQQGLVEDLLEQARRDHPELEAHFDDAREEPVFVKNLENVQGDERDVILMSVCYGPDAEGRVSLNFGPLNREGGERRLNVAITRSREQVIVFSAMRSEQIDLARTQSRGARHLKEFLEYAEFGTAALGQALEVAATAEGSASFRSEVDEALRENGWSTTPDVGCSAYRIDLGVEDPGQAGRFLAAVETDGETYGRAATARDRHGTRPGVLRHLGWTHVRVWSTDWWQDPAGERARVLRILEEARDARRAEREREAEAARAAASAAEKPAEAEADATAEGDTKSAPEDDAEGAQKPSGRIARQASAPETPLGLRLGGEAYRRAKLGRQAGEPRSFYGERAEPMIVRRIEKIIEAEAPVALGVIARRLADAWGLKRITPRLRERVGSLVARAGNWRLGPETVRFFWRRDQDPAAYAAFRVPDSGDKPARRARHIPPEEVANAAAVLLKEHVGIGVEDLARETARLFGYRRITEKVRAPMEEGVRILAGQGRARLDENTIRLP